MSSYDKRMLAVLAAGFLVRLVHLEAPLIGIHSWRQADTAAFARNYAEHGYHFLYPQVDWGGDSQGRVESDFPLYSYVVALVYGVLGVHEAYGRLLSAICFSIANYGLFLLMKMHFDEKTAFWGGLFYGVFPLNLYYSRVFMPEAMMLMCSVLGVYFFARWLATERRAEFWLSAVFVALACLLKPPALYLGLPLLYLAWLKWGRRCLRQGTLWLYAAVVLALFGAWYGHAHRVGLEADRSFGIWEYGSDKWGNWELAATFTYWNKVVFKRLMERNLTWLGFGLFLIGVGTQRKKAGKRLFDYWLLAVVVYFAIVAGGNEVHEYYQLPFLIPAAAFLGMAYGAYFDPAQHRLRGALLGLSVLIVVVKGGLRYSRDYLAHEDPASDERTWLASEVRRLTEPDSLIVALDRGDPTLLYLAHRKGWKGWPAGDLRPDLLAERVRRGARYLAGCRRGLSPEEEQNLAGIAAAGESLLPRGESCFIVRLAPR